MANVETIGLVLAWCGMGCWLVCFWWMHRLSSRQETMLTELHEMTKRIERLSKMEHELMSEVHPAVTDIKDSVADVADAVVGEGGSAKERK